MKRIVIILVICIIILLFSSCEHDSLAGMKETIAKAKYDSYEKLDIAEIVKSWEYEIEIDGKKYNSAVEEAAVWIPITDKIEVVGMADFNGTVLVYRTSSPACYLLSNVDSFRDPQVYVYDVDVDYAEEISVDYYSYYGFNGEYKNELIPIADKNDVNKINKAINGPFEKYDRISDYSRSTSYEVCGEMYIYPKNKSFEGLYYDYNNYIERRTSDGAYCLIAANEDGDYYCTDITEIIKK